MNANEGPAEIAAKISGVNLGGKREDDSPYFTNNEGHPWPDPYEIVLSEKDTSDCKNRAHSKTVGGIPMVSDTFLLQKQQTFNRSKNLERTSSHLGCPLEANCCGLGMVHPCGSGAFGYFECTKDMSDVWYIQTALSCLRTLATDPIFLSLQQSRLS